MDSKKRKYYDSKKRKAINVEHIKIIKCLKIEYSNKRKLHVEIIHCKKQRTCNCIVHEEKYICDIYECNGKINRDNFICK